MDTQPSLIDLFNNYFEVVVADSQEELMECYRLRYKVYCEEGDIPGFHPKDYPEGLEYDQYDERSIHCLLINKLRKLIAGTVRIVLPNQDKPDDKFPLENFAGDWFYAETLYLENLPRSHLGEVSRLILAQEFRGRKGEKKPYGIPEDPEYLFEKNRRVQINASWQGSDHRNNVPRRTFPHAILGLFVAIVRMSVEHDLIFWYAGMEPLCARFLRAFGINFIPISPTVDYYGPCKSYLGNIPEIMENIYRSNQQLWSLLTDNGKYFPRPK